MGTVDPGWLAEPVANTERVLAALRMGRVILLVDDRHSDAAGWLAMAADSATADAVAFIARHTSGVIQAPIASTRFDALRLPVSTSRVTAYHGVSKVCSRAASGGPRSSLPKRGTRMRP